MIFNPGMTTLVHEVHMTHLEWAEAVCAVNAAARALRFHVYSESPIMAAMATGLDDLALILARVQ